MTTLNIKNMVCPRCIMAVNNLLVELSLTPISIVLGEAVIKEDLDLSMIQQIQSKLEDLGFKLLDDPKSKLVEKIKKHIIEWVRTDNCNQEKLSNYLIKSTKKDYNTLSKLFSEVCCISIERYCILQRIEFAKELLCYSKLTISEISFKLGYSSLAHLSGQFKQITGISPKTFKQTYGPKNRQSIDKI